MRKLIAKAWITLDGVFDADSMDQWFDPLHSDARIEQILETVLTSDAFIYGRATYELLAAYWSQLKNNEFGIADKLTNTPKYVVSSTLKTADWDNSIIISENVVEHIASLKKQPGQAILIDGSATLVHSLRETGLIDEYRLLVHPFIMGSGKRFFKEGMGITGLELIETRALDRGVVLLRYQPAVSA